MTGSVAVSGVTGGENVFDDANFVVEATEGDMSMATKDSGTLVSTGTGLLRL